MEKVDLVFGLTSVRQVVQLNRHAVITAKGHRRNEDLIR